jgi:biotin-(acetyl-CoA carboxylase) ligase
MHDLMSDYRRHLYRYRQVAGYRRAGEDQTFRATLAEVTNEGVLHLRHPDGRVEAFASKQVSFVP